MSKDTYNKNFHGFKERGCHVLPCYINMSKAKEACKPNKCSVSEVKYLILFY